MSQQEKEIQKQLIELNKPLLDQNIWEEHSFSVKISVFSIVGFIYAYMLNNNLASFLFMMCIGGVLLLSRFNILAIEKQIQINNKAVASNDEPPENVYQVILNKLNWILLGLFAASIIILFVH